MAQGNRSGRAVTLSPNAEAITPAKLREMSPEQFSATSDAQLLKGVELLQEAEAT